MMPDLLWRCPLCATNDALVEKRRLFRPLHIQCTCCSTVWQVGRVVGEDYELKVVASPSFENELGASLPLARWYARMKGTLALTPIADTAIELADGEHLYLASQQVILAAEDDDPFFFGGPANLRRDKATVRSRRVGTGRLFLTSRRLAWRGEPQARDFSLQRLNSVHALFNTALIVLYELRLYRLHFPHESLLKWVTYFAYVAQEVKAATGHVIATSNF